MITITTWGLIGLGILVFLLGFVYAKIQIGLMIKYCIEQDLPIDHEGKQYYLKEK